MSDAENEKYTWLVGTCGTESDGVDLERVYGTKEQVKRYLVSCVLEDKDGSCDNWEYGTETVDQVEERHNGNLYAYGAYSGSHIDYEATREKPAISLG